MQQVRPHRQRGFTLVELLVVIAILSVLATILLPVFARVRDKARQTQCLSNQRQMGQAFLLYAQDYDETLPFFGDRYPKGRVYWPTLIQTYLGDRRLRGCPSWPQSGKYANLQGLLVKGEFGIGVNYGVLFDYAQFLGRVRHNPTRLIELSDASRTMLLTDSQGSIHVYSPMIWSFAVDWDRDGTPDSHLGLLGSEGPYNRGDPFRHGQGANCAFLDGHARWVPASDWLTNRNDLWGSDLAQN